MTRYLLISFLLGSLLTACTRAGEPTPSQPAPNENVGVLHQQFHGKYKMIWATSDVPVDINLDGTASSDMIREYAYLQNSELRIDIRDGLSNVENIFLFSQGWPEQYFYTVAGEWNGEVIPYEKTIIPSLANQGAVRYFTLSPDRQTLCVKPNADGTTEQSFRWTRPESVTVAPDGTLTVVNKRRVYTSAGVKDIHITTQYQRYTMTT